MKIGFCLFLSYVVAYLPALYTYNGFGPINGHLRYTLIMYYICNFFIYLAIDYPFRQQLLKMCKC